MAFKLVKNTAGGTLYEPVTMTVGDGTYTVGIALYDVSGVLEIASGAVRATHISLENKTLAENGPMLVYRIEPGMEFDCPIEDIDSTYHAVGKIAAFHTDGAQITDAAAGVVYAAATSGGDGTEGADGPTTATPSHTGALIVDMLGAAADGDICRVRLYH